MALTVKLKFTSYPSISPSSWVSPLSWDSCRLSTLTRLRTVKNCKGFVFLECYYLNEGYHFNLSCSSFHHHRTVVVWLKIWTRNGGDEGRNGCNKILMKKSAQWKNTKIANRRWRLCQKVDWPQDEETRLQKHRTKSFETARYTPEKNTLVIVRQKRQLMLLQLAKRHILCSSWWAAGKQEHKGTGEEEREKHKHPNHNKDFLSS